jgi:hypothetical protein
MKVAALLVSGSMLFQFGGCLNLDSLFRNIQVGFARQIGAIPAQAVYDLTIGQILDGVIGGGDTAG